MSGARYGDSRPLTSDRAQVILPSGGATLVWQAERELPEHARAAFRKDFADLIRGTLTPTLEDYEQCCGMALSLARKRGAAAKPFAFTKLRSSSHLTENTNHGSNQCTSGGQHTMTFKRYSG